MNFKNTYSDKINKIDAYISDYLNRFSVPEPEIISAMRYSVLNGGKRLRSVLCTEICSLLGGDYSSALPFAAAIEFIHAYSLVHDDLPAMDNSDTRRGQPSCHKKFDEATAILCGDALLNLSYEIMIEHCDSKPTQKAMYEIAKNSGIRGMVNGQVMDLKSGSSRIIDEDFLVKMVEQKTGALIRAAVLSGAYISGCDQKTIDDMEKFAYHLGMAFQIRDDFEDMEEDADALSDSPNFINTFGEEKSREKLDYHKNISLEILKKYDKNGFLTDFHNYLFN